jgi:hypothetical protein
MGLWHETVVIDGSRIDPNVTDAIQQGGAVLTSTMEGAESLELTVADPDMRFLRSGALTRKGKPRPASRTSSSRRGSGSPRCA